MRLFYLSALIILMHTTTYANFSSPGTGLKWNLDDLVANAGGDVTFSSGNYFVNDTITVSLNDTLLIQTDATVKFIAGSFLSIKGTLLIDPPTGVLFTAQDITTRFLGVWIDLNSSSVINKLTLEYANSLRLSDSHIKVSNSVFRYNSPLTNFGNAAIALFRSNPVISNCQFLNNMRAAISGGANISNAPTIMDCYFAGNNTLNGNVPQINLGTSGSDTVKIINNQLLAASTNSGGIGFLPIGNLQVIIRGNIIRNNRYGITFNGGSNINSLVSYNVIDSNNTQNNPALGGSGIAFSGGSSTSHQNSIVTGNIFRYNLWGITIQGGSKPNLGNIANTDSSDDGKNWFINNTNSTTPGIDLYNNSPDNITAHNNYWNSDDPALIESRIFHQVDDATLGLVDFSSYMVIPVQFTRLSAQSITGGIQLVWVTSSESNSDYFEIEKSLDGTSFHSIGRVGAAGHSAIPVTYRFLDPMFTGNGPVYYRLKILDKDGSFKFSSVVAVLQHEGLTTRLENLYPAIVGNGETLNASISSSIDQVLRLNYYNIQGQLLSTENHSITRGGNTLNLGVINSIPSGAFYVRFIGRNLDQSRLLIKK